MKPDSIRKALRFYFITDPQAPNLKVAEQVEIAVSAGATIVQYRNKNFSLERYDEVLAVRRVCQEGGVPFIVNDNVLLAKAVEADGVHVGQEDTPPALARRILGPDAIIGLSVHTPEELAASDISCCDYLGTGPAFATGTKTDASPVCGPEGIREVARQSQLPVIAIGGIHESNASLCLEAGAAGVAVISAITRALDPLTTAKQLAIVCGIHR